MGVFLVFLYTIIGGGILSFSYANMHRINNTLRYILILPLALLCSSVVTASIRFFVQVLAIFWTGGEWAFNIYFFSYIVLPAMTGYSLIVSSSVVSPKFKLSVGYFFSIVIFIISIAVFYLDLTEEEVLNGDFLLDMYELKKTFFGSVLYFIFTIVGIYFAIRHIKSKKYEENYSG